MWLILLGEMADVADAQDERDISGDKMTQSVLQADTVAQPGSHRNSAALISDQTDFLAPTGFHNDSEAPAGFHNDSEAPAGFHNDSEAPAGFHIDSEAPAGFHNDSEAQVTSENDSEAPASYETDSVAPASHQTDSEEPPRNMTDSEAPDSYQNGSEAPDSYQNDSEAPDSYQNNSVAPASYQTDSQPGSCKEPFLDRPNPQNGSVTSFSGSLSPDGNDIGLMPPAHNHATSQANLSSNRLESKSTRFRSKDEGLEHTSFLLR
jgi:hypothetical protein